MELIILGARLIATSLSNNRSLTYLDLERNKIGPSGCEALASHLILQPIHGATLKTLLLSYNRVGDEGAKALAEVLKCNKSLTNLSLKNNNIKEAGLTVVGSAINSNNTLQKLSIFGNEFCHKVGELFNSQIDRINFIGLDIDISIYHVDGVYMTAEN
mmetsp:Transcript_17902/g.17222  ORF Transcript_17902/g.17222 Transcript_17902/m.17222 type:complete len:158 (-) Transcript_17902:249-722(-)